MIVRYLLVLAVLLTHSRAQAQYSLDSLDLNNIVAGLNANGNLFDDSNHVQYFEVPAHGGVHSMFSAGLWIGGLDDVGQLRLAAHGYNGMGDDFWPGPLDGLGSITQATSDNWNCSSPR